MKFRRNAPSISKLGQRRQVVVPKEICEALGLSEGDFVEFTRKKGAVVIKAKRLVDPDDTLTAREERIVASGFAQLKRGRYVKWEKLKNDLDL